MNQLDFTLSLIDKITQPIKQVQSAVTGFAAQSQKSFKQIAIGGAGLAATFFSLKSLLDPAIELNNALQTASLQGINDSAMKKVVSDAMTFSAQYGKSSLQFTQSALSIRKSIGGLSDSDLPQLTKITNTTAAALKTSADESTAYMGQMFSQFSNYADQIGKVQFAEELAGKAVYMSQAFGTSMAEITNLMEGARSAGTHFGVGIDEQLAVLGELQRTLGSEASSAYEAFMGSASDGAKKLGLSFVDASGKMNGMPEILDKLERKYGKNINGNLKAQKEIEEAFGDSAIVVKQLYGNVDVLRKNITALGANDGMKRTREMADKLANPWERLMSIWESIRMAIGMALLPVISPLITKIADMGQLLVRWLTLFPNIAKVIGYVITAVIGIAAAGAGMNIVMGISRFIWAGLKAIWLVNLAIIKLIPGAVWLGNAAMKAWNITLKFLRGTLLAMRMAAISAGIGINLMSWPVLLVIAAIALLAYGIYKLIQNWDEIKAAIQNTAAFKMLASVVTYVGNLFSKIWADIGQGWDDLCKWFEGASLSKTFSGFADSISNVFSGLWKWLKDTFADVYNGIVNKLNKIPGVSIDTMEIETTATQSLAAIPNANDTNAYQPHVISQQSDALKTILTAANQPQSSGLLTGNQVKGINKNGLDTNGMGTSKTAIDNSRRIENITIEVKQMPSPDQLAEYEVLAHG